MRLVGLIRNQRVVILIDSGSTHNFLDPALLRKVSLCVSHTVKLQVKVANGATIQSDGQCSSVSLKVQGNTITTNFYLLTLGGCDVVLGVEWLRTLGPILWDFLQMTMEYTVGPKQVLLHGLNSTGFTVEEGHHFLKPSHSENKGILLHLLPQEID